MPVIILMRALYFIVVTPMVLLWSYDELRENPTSFYFLYAALAAVFVFILAVFRLLYVFVFTNLGVLAATAFEPVAADWRRSFQTPTLQSAQRYHPRKQISSHPFPVKTVSSSIHTSCWF